MADIQSFVTLASSDEVADVASVRNTVLSELQAYTQRAGFKQLMPILMSPITDPLNHAVYPAAIDYEGRPLKLTASMIFHKQLALMARGHERIFIVAPNIRLEKAEIKNSENHLLEFSQFDFEIRDATFHDAIAFVDGLVRRVLNKVRTECAAELTRLGRELPSYDASFPIYKSEELRAEFGEDFEKKMSVREPTPFFVTNYKREFYDREDPARPGFYNNYDLIYPEGYGEGLSGAEREFEYEQIIRRMDELHMDKTPFANYLAVARQGLLPRSAGGGLGIERFIKFVCGLPEIRRTALFDRSIRSDFVF